MKNAAPRRALLASCLALSLFAGTTTAQGMPRPKASPPASVGQTIGLTEVAIDYHRPGVRGRAIWGGVVPYGQVWRAGANENTTISFADDVTIAGEALPAGTYGLHMIPREDAWTIILSTNSTSWGSYSYDQNEDALRVEIEPQEGPFHEWLTYTIDPETESSGWVTLSWDDVRVSIPVQIDLTQTILDRTRTTYLRGLEKWNPQAWSDAARFCLENEVNMEEAVAWAEEAIRLDKSFTTVSLKTQLLEKLGRGDEAASLKAEAWKVATEDELTTMGQQLMARSQFPQAIAIFELNVRSHPDSWRAHDRLGEAYRQNGEAEKAIRSYGRALDLVQDSGSRQRIEKQVESLRGS